MTTLTASPTESERELEAELALRLSDHAQPSQAPRRSGSSSNPNVMRIANILVLAALFAAPALMCVHAAGVNDFDIWWHLRTGEWIVQHHAIPHVDLFSRSLAGKPWQAYSWLFELIVVKLFHRFGMFGIVAYTAGMVLAIAVALQHLIKRLQSDFTLGALLTFATCFSLLHLYTPRPWMFTILFFTLELDILMHARKTGHLRELAWLPLIFALWSNLHIQFIDGLAVLGLAVGESIVARWGIGEKTPLRAPWLIAALAGSILATLANPFGWHIYRIAYDLATQAGVLNQVSELQSIPFRDLFDYLLLTLALGSAAALAWHRKLAVFETGLLLFAALVSFRSQRDVWVMVAAAAAILASRIVTNRPAILMPRFATPLAVLAAALVVLAGFPLLHVNNTKLQTRLAETLPVHAVEAIQANRYAGPLYDDYNWGGYLIWALRMPVSIDGRAAFYGDVKIDRSIATWGAQPDWASDPELVSSGLVIGPVKAALTQLLRTDPRFQLVYQDKIAAVFIRRK